MLVAHTIVHNINIIYKIDAAQTHCVRNRVCFECIWTSRLFSICLALAARGVVMRPYVCSIPLCLLR